MSAVPLDPNIIDGLMPGESADNMSQQRARAPPADDSPVPTRHPTAGFPTGGVEPQVFQGITLRLTHSTDQGIIEGVCAERSEGT